jgi:hypothetical protein
LSTGDPRWLLQGMPPCDPPMSLPERWRQAIARRGQPEPVAKPEQARVAEPEDFADTQPDCHGP